MSGTAVHLVSKPKEKTDKKRRTKKIPSLSEPTTLNIVTIQTPTLQASESQPADAIEVPVDATKQSLEASKSLEEQDNRPHTADTTKKQENVFTEEVHMADDEYDNVEYVESGIQSICDVPLKPLNKDAYESHFDTTSEIKFTKKYNPRIHAKQYMFTTVSSKESDAEEDSDLALIPDDEIGSPSAFQTLDIDKESLSKPKLSKSEEKDVDNVLDELADLQASADKPSDNISHLQQEITSLSTKVG
ncbi:hypothetical protein Tco_1295703 [Tanacetum coccineum]